MKDKSKPVDDRAASTNLGSTLPQDKYREVYKLMRIASGSHPLSNLQKMQK